MVTIGLDLRELSVQSADEVIFGFAIHTSTNSQ